MLTKNRRMLIMTILLLIVPACTFPPQVTRIFGPTETAIPTMTTSPTTAASPTASPSPTITPSPTSIPFLITPLEDGSSQVIVLQFGFQFIIPEGWGKIEMYDDLPPFDEWDRITSEGQSFLHASKIDWDSSGYLAGFNVIVMPATETLDGILISKVAEYTERENYLITNYGKLSNAFHTPVAILDMRTHYMFYDTKMRQDISLSIFIAEPWAITLEFYTFVGAFDSVTQQNIRSIRDSIQLEIP